METLPAGLFAGLAGLREASLEGNPGAPFALAVELARTDAADLSAPGPARVQARLASGAPFALRAALSAAPPAAELPAAVGDRRRGRSWRAVHGAGVGVAAAAGGWAGGAAGHALRRRAVLARHGGGAGRGAGAVPASAAGRAWRRNWNRWKAATTCAWRSLR